MILKDNREDIIRLMRFFEKYGIHIRLDTISIKGNALKNKELFFNKNDDEISEYIYELLSMLNYSKTELAKSIEYNKCSVGIHFFMSTIRENFSFVQD